MTRRECIATLCSAPLAAAGYQVLPKVAAKPKGMATIARLVAVIEAQMQGFERAIVNLDLSLEKAHMVALHRNLKDLPMLTKRAVREAMRAGH